MTTGTKIISAVVAESSLHEPDIHIIVLLQACKICVLSLMQHLSAISVHRLTLLMLWRWSVGKSTSELLILQGPCLSHKLQFMPAAPDDACTMAELHGPALRIALLHFSSRHRFKLEPPGTEGELGSAPVLGHQCSPCLAMMMQLGMSQPIQEPLWNSAAGRDHEWTSKAA